MWDMKFYIFNIFFPRVDPFLIFYSDFINLILTYSWTIRSSNFYLNINEILWLSHNYFVIWFNICKDCAFIPFNFFNFFKICLSFNKSNINRSIFWIIQFSYLNFRRKSIFFQFLRTKSSFKFKEVIKYTF